MENRNQKVSEEENSPNSSEAEQNPENLNKTEQNPKDHIVAEQNPKSHIEAEQNPKNPIEDEQGEEGENRKFNETEQNPNDQNEDDEQGEEGENRKSNETEQNPNDHNEDEEGEEEECGFCLFMKAGGCRDAFIDWEKCVEEGETNNQDVVEKCYKVTALLKDCMDSHAEYYAPVLRAEKEMEEQVAEEMKEHDLEVITRESGSHDLESRTESGSQGNAAKEMERTESGSQGNAAKEMEVTIEVANDTTEVPSSQEKEVSI